MTLAPAVTVVAPAVAVVVAAPRLTTPPASAVLSASPAMTLLTLGIAFPPRKDYLPQFRHFPEYLEVSGMPIMGRPWLSWFPWMSCDKQTLTAFTVFLSLY
jgi:hypothetical protein